MIITYKEKNKCSRSVFATIDKFIQKRKRLGSLDDLEWIMKGFTGTIFYKFRLLDKDSKLIKIIFCRDLSDCFDYIIYSKLVQEVQQIEWIVGKINFGPLS
jgi:hypothetical protein